MSVISTHYRSWVILDVEASRVSRQWPREDANVVSLTHRPPLPPRRCPWYSFLFDALSGTQDHIAGRKIKSMKNPSDPMGDRTCDHPTCSELLQPTAPPRIPYNTQIFMAVLGIYLQKKKESPVRYGYQTFFNLLKPTGYVMHHQFNIQQLYVLPTLYLCVLYLSENKQWLVPLTA